MFGKIPFTQNQIIAVTCVINIVKKKKKQESQCHWFPKPRNYITWARSRCHRKKSYLSRGSGSYKHACRVKDRQILERNPFMLWRDKPSQGHRLPESKARCSGLGMHRSYKIWVCDPRTLTCRSVSTALLVLEMLLSSLPNGVWRLRNIHWRPFKPHLSPQECLRGPRYLL